MSKLARAAVWLLSGLGMVVIVGTMPQLASTRDQDTPTLDPRPWPVWQTEQVLPDAISLDLAVDTASRPHILYQLPDDTMLRYGVGQEDGWSFRPVADLPAGGEQVSLSLDDQDRPHIAYIDGATDQVVYGAPDGDGWLLEPVTTGGVSLSLAMAGATPHLVVSRAGMVTYRRLDAGQWISETVAAVGPYAPAWLALDASGRPHVAYPLGGGSEIAIRTGDNAWDRFDGPSGDAMTFALGSSGELYFIVMESRLVVPRPPQWENELFLAEQSGTEWRREWVQGIFNDHYALVELLIGSEDRLHLFTATQYDRLVSYQWRAGVDDWRWENPGGYELSNHAALGPDDQPRLLGGGEGGLFLKRRTIQWLDHHALLPVVGQ